MFAADGDERFRGRVVSAVIGFVPLRRWLSLTRVRRRSGVFSEVGSSAAIAPA